MYRYYVWMQTWRTSQKGQALSEYGLVLAILAIGVIVGLVALRDQLVALFQALAGKMHL